MTRPRLVAAVAMVLAVVLAGVVLFGGKDESSPLARQDAPGRIFEYEDAR